MWFGIILTCANDMSHCQPLVGPFQPDEASCKRHVELSLPRVGAGLPPNVIIVDAQCFVFGEST